MEEEEENALSTSPRKGGQALSALPSLSYKAHSQPRKGNGKKYEKRKQRNHYRKKGKESERKKEGIFPPFSFFFPGKLSLFLGVWIPSPLFSPPSSFRHLSLSARFFIFRSIFLSAPSFSFFSFSFSLSHFLSSNSPIINLFRAEGGRGRREEGVKKRRERRGGGGGPLGGCDPVKEGERKGKGGIPRSLPR